MSEEILKALTQLFAIITKQDGGVTENERQFVINFFQQELDKDSVKTLGICKKINKTLTQKQKIIVLTKLLELVGSDKNFTPQRMEIINTVSTVFNISQEEYKLIEGFVIAEDDMSLNYPDILILNSRSKASLSNQKHVHGHISGHLIFMRVQSVDMYFVKYVGDEGNVLNGFAMQPGKVYLFSHG